MSKYSICTSIAASGVKACAARNLHKSQKKEKEGKHTVISQVCLCVHSTWLKVQSEKYLPLLFAQT